MKTFLTKIFLTVFVVLLIGCEQPVAPGSDISQQELSERLANNDAPLILDVRSADEFAEGHLPGAVNIPHTEVGERIAELNLDKSDEIVIHCFSGRRAGIATETLQESGYTNVRNLEGHWQGWQAAGLPVE